MLSAILCLCTAAGLHAPEQYQAGAFDADFVGLKFGDDAVLRSGTETIMNLQMLNDTLTTGAVCLDGSPGGFYFSAATAAANKNDWQIYFQGGGWCYDDKDCWHRSNSNLGSSKGWPTTASIGGLFDSDCERNPAFCNFNRVWLVYCDGNSFSGNRDAPLKVVEDGVKANLYFRGRRILDETLKALAKDYGLSKASNVLLTGCSAGGLATYLHTDYVEEQLRTKYAPGMTRYKATSMSGFFLQHKTVEGLAVYPTQMKNIFEMSNATYGVNAACIEAMNATSQWQCNFAQHAYAYTKSPTFPLNSALDSWQTLCIYTSELPPGWPNQKGTENGVCGTAKGWMSCAKDPERCDPKQMTTMNQYISDFDATISTSGSTYGKAGNGAFIHSCHTHCEAQSGEFFRFRVNGVSMQEAVSKWWDAPVTDPAASHTYSPCQYKTTSPHMCNPTCQ